MNDNNKYSRGSEWRKWDLHIHTPCSVMNNQFSGSTDNEKWDNYLHELSTLDDISVLGITDYFSIDGYKRVKEYKDSGNLSNIDFILPNVELRIIPVTGSDTPINLHIIFSPDIVDDLETKFFSSLEFSYAGEKFKCVRSDLIKLGKKCKNDNSLPEETAYKSGIEQFKVDSVNKLRDIIRGDISLRDNSILAVSNNSQDGNSGIPDSSLTATREEIYRLVHCIFSGNPRDRDYFLGNGVDNCDELIRKYGSLKPCIHGSDAHSLEKICRPDLQRFTWIKADPCFEGLKQILFEPSERVRIQEQNPQSDFCKSYFSMIKIEETQIFNGKNVMFSDTEIQLNPNLVAIIGGRGTGKSLFFDGFAKTFDKTGAPRIESISIYDKLIVFHTKEDNSITEYKIQNENFLEYLHITQGEVRIIADDSKILDKEIKKMLGIKDTIIQERFEQQTLLVLNDFFKMTEWFDYTDSDGNFSNRKEYNEKIKKKYEDLIVSITNDNNKTLVEQYRTNNSKINQAELRLNELDIIRNTIDDFIRDINSRIGNINSNLIHEQQIPPVDLSEQSKVIITLEKFLSDEKNKLETENKDIEKNFVILGIKTDISSLLDNVSSYQSEIERSSQKINEISEKEIEIQSIIERRNELVNGFKSALEQQINEIENSWRALIEGKEGWSPDQKDLIKSLLSGIELSAIINFDLDVFYRKIRDCLDMRKFKETKNETSEEKIRNTFNINGFEEFIKLLRNECLIENINSTKVNIDTFVNGDLLLKDKIQEFYRILFSPKHWFSYLKVFTKIKYNGKEPYELSVGQRGTLFICMKLATNPFSTPFIFDQPEDDLDNNFIMNELVPIFKKIKKYRQVIIATHNANIVVNADAEQIIVAHNDSEKLSYISGSLENTFNDTSSISPLKKQGIREHVCEILEGGRDAFEKREKKYGFK